MRKSTAAFGVAAALTIFPASSAVADHSATTPAAQDDTATDDDDSDKTGLWGLLGLLGLAGLAGLKRRDRVDYQTRATTTDRTGTGRP